MTGCIDFEVFVTLNNYTFLKNKIAFIDEELGLYRLIFIMLFFLINCYRSTFKISIKKDLFTRIWGLYKYFFRLIFKFWSIYFECYVFFVIYRYFSSNSIDSSWFSLILNTKFKLSSNFRNHYEKGIRKMIPY